MAQQSINQLKQWFETGDYPTQQQFYDWLDSFVHKDDELTLASIDGLIEILEGKADSEELEAIEFSKLLAAGTTSWLVPAGTLIEKFLIIAPTAINFKIGTTNGGQELIEEYAIEVGYSVYGKDVYFAADTTIYFGGVAGNTIIKIFKR